VEKLLVRTLFLTFCLFVLSPIFADILPEGSHFVEYCVKVVNLDQFPDVVLIGYVTGPMVRPYEAYVIKSGECLIRGYKFNKLSIYQTTQEKFKTMDLEKLNLEDLVPLLEVKRYVDFVDDKDPLKKEIIEYSLAQISDGKLVIYKSKQISSYNNGAPDKIENFAAPVAVPVSGQKPVEEGLWHSIVCFFKKLFGGNC
jgi:hypothetical protein